MESLYFGIHGIRHSGKTSIVNVAAVAADENGAEKASIELWASPGEEVLSAVGQESLSLMGWSAEALRAGEPQENAAKALRGFLEAYPGAPGKAFCSNRAKAMLELAPWKFGGPWAEDIRQGVQKTFQEGAPDDLTLYEAASLLGVAIPPKRTALSDARISLKIVGKLGGIKHTMIFQDRAFLWEAIQLMEDGF